MKREKLTSVAGALLIAATLSSGWAQPGNGQNNQQREQQGRREQPQGQQGRQQPQQQPRQGNQQQSRPQQSQRSAPPQRSAQQARSWQQSRGWQQRGSWQGRDSWQGNRAQRWEVDHRSWSQRGGYGGYYIPQSRFSLSFGPQHAFRIQTRPSIYMGYPQFAYGGYSFLMVDPWPEYWSENWYASDDVYVDYDDGYYLYNRRYPQVRLAVTIRL